MVKKIIIKVINMKQKREIVKRSLKMYHKSSKREKGRRLTELSQIIGYNRKYLTYLLNIAKKRIITKTLYKLNEETSILLNELDKAYSRKHDRTIALI